MKEVIVKRLIPSVETQKVSFTLFRIINAKKKILIIWSYLIYFVCKASLTSTSQNPMKKSGWLIVHLKDHESPLWKMKHVVSRNFPPLVSSLLKFCL